MLPVAAESQRQHYPFVRSRQPCGGGGRARSKMTVDSVSGRPKAHVESLFLVFVRRTYSRRTGQEMFLVHGRCVCVSGDKIWSSKSRTLKSYVHHGRPAYLCLVRTTFPTNFVKSWRMSVFYELCCSWNIDIYSYPGSIEQHRAVFKRGNREMLPGLLMMRRRLSFSRTFSLI